MRICPLNLNCDSAIAASSLLVGGGVRTAELAVIVPLKLLDEPLQLEPEWGMSLVENQPTGGPLTSIGSAAEPPSVGLPQITNASLVCIGPLMKSPLTKEIVLQ